MFGLGMYEVMIIGIVAVLLFGSKLPDVAKSLGKSYREFRTGLNDIQNVVDTDTYNEPAGKSSSASSSSSSSYSNDFYDDDVDEPTAPKFDPPPAEAKPKVEREKDTEQA